jgi:hypothetical protein
MVNAQMQPPAAATLATACTAGPRVPPLEPEQSPWEGGNAGDHTKCMETTSRAWSPQCHCRGRQAESLKREGTRYRVVSGYRATKRLRSKWHWHTHRLQRPRLHSQFHAPLLQQLEGADRCQVGEVVARVPTNGARALHQLLHKCLEHGGGAPGCGPRLRVRPPSTHTHPDISNRCE